MHIPSQLLHRLDHNNGKLKVSLFISPASLLFLMPMCLSIHFGCVSVNGNVSCLMHYQHSDMHMSLKITEFLFLPGMLTHQACAGCAHMLVQGQV